MTFIISIFIKFLFILTCLSGHAYPVGEAIFFHWPQAFFLALVANDSLDNLLQGAGMALLTVLIPLAIAVLTGFLDRKSRKENDKLLTLELHMVMDDILNIKQLVLWNAFIFIPTLFWNQSHNLVRGFELILSAIGIIYLTKRIFIVHRWIKSNDFSFHFAYLAKLNDPVELATVWNSVWQQDNLPTPDESRFLEVLSKKVDKFLGHGN